MGAPISAPFPSAPTPPPPPPRCLYLFCDIVFVRGAPIRVLRGASRLEMGAQPALPFPLPTQKPAVPPLPHVLLQTTLTPEGQGAPRPPGQVRTWVMEVQIPPAPGVWGHPPTWGCSPSPCHGLALAGRAGSGWGGAWWRGLFPAQRSQVGTPIHPQSAVSSWIWLLGVFGAWHCLHRACLGPGWGGLHAASFMFGAVCGGHPGVCPQLGAGGAAVTFPAPNWTLWGGDMPTCQGHAMCLAGLGNAPYLHSQSVTWGGTGHSPAWRQSPPTLYPQAAGPGQLCVPIPTCLGTCCCSQGGSFGTPNSSGWCLYPHGLQSLAGGVAGTSAPLCGPGEDRSLWPDPGLPQPTDTPPLLLPAVFHHRGCQGQGWLSPLCCTPPMAVSHPEFGYMSLGGGAASVVPPPPPP